MVKRAREKEGEKKKKYRYIALLHYKQTGLKNLQLFVGGGGRNRQLSPTLLDLNQGLH